MKKEFDLFVIGAGSGGVRAARVAASRGLKVGIAEGWSLGGTCVNRGCVPKKLYSYASHFEHDFNVMRSFGWSIKTISFSWNKLVSNKKKEILRLNNIYKNLLVNSGVEIFSGFANFIDKNTIEVSKKKIIAKKILIAVGSEPRKINFSAKDKIINSDQAFDIKKLPKKVMILGGGYIAVEFASIFNGLGVDTTICVRGDNILRGFDTDVVQNITNQMKERGVKFIQNNFPKDITFQNNKFKVIFDDNKVYKTDLVMEATGRVPNIDSLKLDKVGVKVSDNKSIKVDEFFRTSIKNIFAIGDVIDRVQLTPVAIAEAMVFVDNLFQKKLKKFDYNNIPTAVFCHPNYAYIGLSEEEAKLKVKKIKVFRSLFKPLKNSLSNINDKVFIKLIVNNINEKVIGLHYVGENAAEIIQGFSVSITAGLKKKHFDKTIGIHPSSAEEIVTLK